MVSALTGHAHLSGMRRSFKLNDKTAKYHYKRLIINELETNCGQFALRGGRYQKKRQLLGVNIFQNEEQNKPTKSNNKVALVGLL